MDSPSVREKRLARELQVLRGAAQLHGKDVAARLGWSASKISRIESGRSGVRESDLERLLELYDVPPQQAALLRALAPATRPRGWWDAYADTLSSGYANLIRMEAGSSALQCYCGLVPHALLQTADYTREVVRTTWRNPAAAEVERRVQICGRRQDLVDPASARPLRVQAVVDEAVLRRQVTGDGGREVLRAQLAHLAEAARWPHVTIQVLPFAAGLTPVTSGSFSVLESAATGAADVVYLENKTRVFVIEAETEVHAYTQDFALLSRLALPPKASRALLLATVAGLA